MYLQRRVAEMGGLTVSASTVFIFECYIRHTRNTRHCMNKPGLRMGYFHYYGERHERANAISILEQCESYCLSYSADI